jgi:hypothetical protein
VVGVGLGEARCHLIACPTIIRKDDGHRGRRVAQGNTVVLHCH